MHELSIVMSIVDIASKQAVEAGSERVEEVEIDIGTLSTVEMHAFDFAWEQGIKGTILANAKKNINRIEARGKCMECGEEFRMENVYDACPVCGNYLVDIIKGKELKVRSIVVS
ncbi:MAG: hydrogenase maturation nickel metallochaperone HypA [Bacteroidetes bacterium]|nr:hydrogenase maturation nickel metallochaperone HypA [Bacteroidota bacterium]